RRRAQGGTRPNEGRLCYGNSAAPELSGEMEWGSRGWAKQIKGCFAVVDESDEIAAGNREASFGAISLVPSREALAYLLPRLGFAETVVLIPPPDSYEQLARGVRVIIAATVQPGA